MLKKHLIKNNIISKLSKKQFGNAHNHNHNNHGEHGGNHDDHHDHHHHEPSGELNLEAVFVQRSQTQHRFISILGLQMSHHEEILQIKGNNKAANAVTPIPVPLLTSKKREFKNLAGTPDEENNYFHSEPYGYAFGNNVLSINNK